MFPLSSEHSQSSDDPGAHSSYPVIGGSTTATGGLEPAGSGFKGLPHPTRQNTKAPLILIVAGAVVGCVAVVAITFALTRGAGEGLPATGSSGGSETTSETGSAPGSRSNPTLEIDPTAPPRPDASRVALNVSVPISQPECDGSGIVVLRSAVTPGKYGPEIQRYLDEFPGSSYLRTDHSCPSLRQSTDNGNPIYAVYRPAGRTEADICSAVRRSGGDAYGKWLDTTTDPRYMITC